MEIIALGNIAISGTSKLVERYSEKLKDRFRQDLLDLATDNANNNRRFNRNDFADVASFIEVGKGGIFAALWDLGESLNCGLNINLKDIPVCQETIEICNFLDVNPYELESEGMYLLAVNTGYSLCEKFKAEGNKAVIIGHTTDNNDRIIRNGDLVRYIDKNRGKEALERVD